MNQSLCISEDISRTLTAMKSHQRRDILLCIDEILTALDRSSPAASQWKAARRFMQLIEEEGFAGMAGIPIGAAHG